MKDAALGGGNLFQKFHGMSIFQYMKDDSTLNKYFNDAMADLSCIQTRKILEVYNGFEGISVLVDVGGGKGATLHAIVSKCPSIKGINFDLPQVVQHAPPYPGFTLYPPVVCPEEKRNSWKNRTDAFMNAGIEHVVGDMFESVPKGDAIMIKVRSLVHSHDLWSSSRKCELITTAGNMSQLERRVLHQVPEELLQGGPGEWQGDCHGLHHAGGAGTHRRVQVRSHARQCHVHSARGKGEDREGVRSSLQRFGICRV